MRNREGCLCMLGVVGMARENIGGGAIEVADLLFQYRPLISFERVQSPRYDCVRSFTGQCHG